MSCNQVSFLTANFIPTRRLLSSIDKWDLGASTEPSEPKLVPSPQVRHFRLYSFPLRPKGRVAVLVLYVHLRLYTPSPGILTVVPSCDCNGKCLLASSCPETAKARLQLMDVAYEIVRIVM
ncbi:unnamed protein product [Albugo candida]|uniref:Uncharacterized protein n=1 Tax=Albugo candida TaxID=65357 RepID=A0A024GI31_9STRA|nr:unnamed protein product [Albugo candida]|eukprot:CCI46186.1 unnamed protein product [Albugo candida]